MAFNKDRTKAFEIAYEQFGTQFTKLAEQTIRLLEKIRELKWSTDNRAKAVVAPLSEPHQQSAAVLHQRGEELSHADSCKRCREGKGVWQSCVVAPVYKDGALTFEKSGGKAWDSSLTEGVIQSGGLFAVVQQEASQKEMERERRELERERKELQRQREELERLRQEDQRQRPEREIRLGALRQNNRQPDLAVVVPSPHRVTKNSPRVKIDRTMGWSNKLLTSGSLEQVGAARRQMQEFVQLLVAHEAGLTQQRITLTELRNRGSPSASWDSLSGLDASFGSASSEGDISWTRRSGLS
ncbi:hypothetical protein CNMCM5793_006752 [Aspergillus hiratsukae]|uniref:Uncharacterized protein n=1 Tax=Aspergillus hiratsukae TaxID=1194566 RepID=A0A8H6V373_9EURO|nr:hypothetical protein CNMCM5793_006752 [Aspergillus hiratsukae]KAF7173654.1 hypothetical protein CNMCM6106_007699 [Aspergillus hiratsukae]